MVGLVIWDAIASLWRHCNWAIVLLPQLQRGKPQQNITKREPYEFDFSCVFPMRLLWLKGTPFADATYDTDIMLEGRV